MFLKYENNKRNYIAIIGDIKNSKNILDREKTQIWLGEILEGINNKYKDNIAAKFIITLGDEFQGLLHDGKNVINIISEIEQKLYPVKVRFGVGIGEISTEINPMMALGADGSAYYCARRAIEKVKENEKKRQIGIANIRIEDSYESDYTSINQGTIELLNNILELLEIIKNSWTDRQREIIGHMMKNMSSQTEVANYLNIRQPAVQKSLAKGHYYTYKKSIETLEHALGEVRRG